MLHGSYCHACGEKLASRSDLTLRGYLTELLSELLDADGRFFKTIATLVARPGGYSLRVDGPAEVVNPKKSPAGRRGSYFSDARSPSAV